MKKTALILILVLTFTSLYAQSERRKADTTSIPSALRFGIDYRSDYYYMGRADSAKAPYITPSLAYFHKSGLFISGNLSYLTAEGQNRIDLYTLSAGYDYNRNQFAAGASISQYFFNDSSYAVQAEMSTYTSAYIGYDLKWLMIFVDGSLGLSSEVDVFLGAEISRAFYLLQDKLRLRPSFYTNFGTQHYYRDYYVNRSIVLGGPGKNNGKKNGGNNTGNSGPGGGGDTSNPPETTIITEARTLNSEKFQVLDYELSLQASYRLNQFQIISSATVLFPVNPSTVVTDQTTYIEELENGFLWSLGIRYSLK